MSLNAYINDFKDGRTLKEKCSVCNKTITGEYFSFVAEDRGTRAQVKENRLCSKRCLNNVTLEMNRKEQIRQRSYYGPDTRKYSDSDV